MFINKLGDKPLTNPTTMSSYINLFLKTEITCIPKILNTYLGDYYNNALCNGATWVFVLWCTLHILFDKFVDAFLKKLRYREYVRTRLKDSLWYLGFYGTSLVYCGAALAQNEVELFNFKKMSVPSSSNLPSKVMLGYTLISTFYLHSSFWEGLSKGSLTNMFNYLFLFAFLVSSYILRVVEISFTLTALIGIAQTSIQITRCIFMLSEQDNFFSKFIGGSLYVVTFAIYLAIHIIVIPLTFVVPLALKILSDYPNILLVFLFCNLGLWIITEIYKSILFKLVDHWLHHDKTAGDHTAHMCPTGLFECSLFKPRDDDSYTLQNLRKEIKARKSKMMSLRKPKNKNMIIQTLKCMVALKRKLNQRRLSESSDSDDSEKSEENGTSKQPDCVDNDSTELLSEQEVESDDEDSKSQESVIENEKFLEKKNLHESTEKNEISNDDENYMCEQDNVINNNNLRENLIDNKTVSSQNICGEKVDSNDIDSNQEKIEILSLNDQSVTMENASDSPCESTSKK